MNKIQEALDYFEQLIGMFETQEVKEEKKILKAAREELEILKEKLNEKS